MPGSGCFKKILSSHCPAKGTVPQEKNSLFTQTEKWVTLSTFNGLFLTSLLSDTILTFPCDSWKSNIYILRRTVHSCNPSSCIPVDAIQHSSIQWKTNFRLSKTANAWADKSRTWRFLKGPMPLSWSAQRTSSQLSLKQGDRVLTLCNFSSFLQFISNLFRSVSYPSAVIRLPVLISRPRPICTACHEYMYISRCLPGFCLNPQYLHFIWKWVGGQILNLVPAKSNGEAPQGPGNYLLLAASSSLPSQWPT